MKIIVLGEFQMMGDKQIELLWTAQQLSRKEKFLILTKNVDSKKIHALDKYVYLQKMSGVIQTVLSDSELLGRIKELSPCILLCEENIISMDCSMESKKKKKKSNQ